MHNVKKILFLFIFFGVLFFTIDTYALDRTYVLYVCNFNNSTCSRYITLNDGQIDRGTIINHDNGSYPNAQTFFLGQTNWENAKRYIINIDYTIQSSGSPLSYSSKFNHINTMFDTSARIGTTEYTLLSSSSNNGIYTYHYSIRSDITFPRSVSSVALHANFSTNTFIRYIKVNSWSVTPITNNNVDIINNANQNTTNIINNNNQNTTIINDSLNDINDTLSDSNTDNNLGSRFMNLFSHNDHALASIVTAPLTFLNSLDDPCQPITIPFKLGGGNGCGGLPVCVNSTFTKDATIQCGDTIFWNRSDVSVFRLFWNVLFGGALIYMLGFKLFKTINRALDPFVDDINGLEV